MVEHISGTSDTIASALLLLSREQLWLKAGQKHRSWNAGGSCLFIKNGHPSRVSCLRSLGLGHPSWETAGDLEDATV